MRQQKREKKDGPLKDRYWDTSWKKEWDVRPPDIGSEEWRRFEEGSDATPRRRSLSVSLEGIPGFREGMRSIDMGEESPIGERSPVPSVEAAIPLQELTPDLVERLFSALTIERHALREKCQELLRHEKGLKSAFRLLAARRTLEFLGQRGEDEGVVRARRETEAEQKSALSELEGLLVDQPEEFRILQTLSGDALSQRLHESTALYLRELQQCERDTSTFLAKVRERKVFTDTAREQAVSVNALRKGQMDIALAQKLFPYEKRFPMVIASGVEWKRLEDQGVLESLATLPSSIGDGYSPESLLCMHVHRIDQKEAAPKQPESVKYVATYVFANTADASLPLRLTEKDVSYLHIAVERKPDGTLQWGYPSKMRLPTMHDTYLDRLEGHHLENAGAIVRGMNIGDRMFRAGETEGKMRQIAPNLWGKRERTSAGITTFTLIERDPNTEKYRIKVISLDVGDRKDDAQLWVRAMDTARKTGKYGEPRLLPEERVYGQELFRLCQQTPWQNDVDPIVVQNLIRETKSYNEELPPSEKFPEGEQREQHRQWEQREQDRIWELDDLLPAELSLSKELERELHEMFKKIKNEDRYVNLREHILMHMRQRLHGMDPAEIPPNPAELKQFVLFEVQKVERRARESLGH